VKDSGNGTQMPRQTAVDVSEVTIRTVERGSDGLIGWASVVIAHSVRLNHIAVRRGRDGGVYLTFPVKLLASGERNYHYFPIDRLAAKAIHDAVVARLAGLADIVADDGARNE
jgi:DNA-binding cell septation regulator SpoVG